MEPVLSECFGFAHRIRGAMASLDCKSQTSDIYQDSLIKFLFDNKHVGGPIIELGCYKGGLTAQLAFMAKVSGTHLFVVDVSPEWLQHTKSLLEKFNLNTHTTFYKGTLADFAADAEFTRKPLLLIIDGDHRYEKVLEDIESIYKLNMIPYAVAFHDYSLRYVSMYNTYVDKAIHDSFGPDINPIRIGEQMDECPHLPKKHNPEPREGLYWEEHGSEGVILYPPGQLPESADKIAATRPVGQESRKTHKKRIETGFYKNYMSGTGLDIGFLGYVEGVVPILPGATGIDLNYPGYDGIRLPFPDDSQDYVFSSHVLEHVADYTAVLREWHRVVKPGGHIVITVPHWHLYEKRQSPPSDWNKDHKRFYTPGTLMAELEESLTPNTYRVVHLRDNDDGFNYDIPPGTHSKGCYEVECVIRKLEEPHWKIA
ncbi:MAG: methyltransferase domain-containing protein [Syntrophobacter sp.]